MKHLVIIGNAECRRVAFWQAALSRHHWLRAKIVSYLDLLLQRTELSGYLRPGTYVRIENAADNWETFKHLLRYGLAPAVREDYPALTESEIARLEYQRGWLVKPRQAYLGFIHLIKKITQEVAAQGSISLNPADEIAVCFDKTLCQRRLHHAGITIPFSLETIRDYDAIRSRFYPAGRAMVKLAHGSGAAGCLAIHWSNGRVRALTTLSEVIVNGGARMYCSKRLQVLQNEMAIASLVNRLCVERIHVEEWLPKAQWNGRNFDLRVVTIAGVPRHTVPRVGSSPFTNLTLGNGRGNLTEIKARMGPDAWEDLRQTCTKVAAKFPGSLTLGIDVLLRPDFRRHAVLEVNAFGDLLLNQLDNGQDTYSAAVTALDQAEWSSPDAMVAS